MLKIENLIANYGRIEALHGISLEVREHEIVRLKPTVLGKLRFSWSRVMSQKRGKLNWQEKISASWRLIKLPGKACFMCLKGDMYFLVLR